MVCVWGGNLPSYRVHLWEKGGPPQKEGIKRLTTRGAPDERERCAARARVEVRGRGNKRGVQPLHNLFFCLAAVVSRFQPSRASAPPQTSATWRGCRRRCVPCAPTLLVRARARGFFELSSQPARPQSCKRGTPLHCDWAREVRQCQSKRYWQRVRLVVLSFLVPPNDRPQRPRMPLRITNSRSVCTTCMRRLPPRRAPWSL